MTRDEDTDRITPIPRQDAISIDDTKTLAPTAVDDDESFEKTQMSRTRTIEEADFHGTFKKQDTVDA